MYPCNTSTPIHHVSKLSEFFSQEVQRHMPKLLKRAAVLIQNNHHLLQAEDYVQEAAGKLWKSLLQSGEVPEDLFPYLMQQLKNCVVDDVRRQSADKRGRSHTVRDFANLNGGWILELKDSSCPEPFEAVQVDEMIGSLPDSDWRTLVRMRMERRTVQECADSMELSKRSVEARLKDLREYLKEKYDISLI